MFVLQDAETRDFYLTVESYNGMSTRTHDKAVTPFEADILRLVCQRPLDKLPVVPLVADITAQDVVADADTKGKTEQCGDAWVSCHISRILLSGNFMSVSKGVNHVRLLCDVWRLGRSSRPSRARLLRASSGRTTC